MKKLFCILIAVSILITAQTMVFAETDETVSDEVSNEVSNETSEEVSEEIPFSATAYAEYTTSNGLGTYNPDSEIVVNVRLAEPSIPETVDGISVFMLSILYDSDAVTLLATGASDIDGDAFDYNHLIVSSPDGWECFGSNDTQAGVFELAVWDPDAITHFTEGTLEIAVPFKVNSDTKASTIEFGFSDCQIVDNDLVEYAEIAISPILVEYALQPDAVAEVPLGSVGIDLVGYGDGNQIFYADDEITVGEYVALFADTANGEDKMSDYAIAIVDASNGVIVYCDSEIGAESDKSNVVIPSGHYIIAVKGDNVSDYEEFVITAETDAQVDLYNINAEAAKDSTDGAVAIENAAFVITDAVPVLKEDVNAIYDYESAIIKVYDEKLDLAGFKAMFENNVDVLDANGNELYGGYIKTGMTLDYADGVTIVMMGDVDSDGEITQRDYMLIKRYCFSTFELSGANLIAAHVAGNDTVSVADYLIIKRICFKTYSISDAK